MSSPLLGELLWEGAAAAPYQLLLSDETVSYTLADAWGFTRRLATVLDRLGVGVGSRVAIVAHRDATTVQLVLGLLANGRVVLALEPDRGGVAERLRRCRCDLVLDGRAPTRSGVTKAQLPRTPQELATLVAGAAPGEPPTLQATDLAYLIFTSGSTSTAKAVAIAHGSLAVATADWLRVYGTPAPSGGGYLQYSSTGFDPFYADLVRAVAGRYRLVICPDRLRLDPRAMVELIRRERIGMVDLTPAVARLVLTELAATGSALPDLHQLVLGGEAWRVGELRRLRALLPGCRIINAYGLVETTIDNFYYDAVDDLPGVPDEWYMPLGGPFARCDYAIGPPGDASGGQPGQDGREHGELWIRGPYVGAGYLRDDGTVDPTPFRYGGSPWFPTGDLVRRGQGRLWYLGRTGSTVKVHGTRVNLEEVDAVLARHPAVAQAATVLVDASAAVVASVYVPRAAGASPSLRSQVVDALGPLAAPSLVLERASLPLNANGKVDKWALAAWARAQWESLDAAGAAGEAPDGTPLAFLREFCRSELGVGQVDPDVPVGGLGLDSLEVARLLAALGHRYGCRLPSERVFSRPTLRQLAEEAAASRAALSPPARPAGRHRLTTSQRELLLHGALHEDPAVYVVPWVIRVVGRIDPDLVERGLRAVVAAHEPLRSHYRWADGDWFAEPVEASIDLQRVSAGDAPPADVVAELLARPFDLAAEAPIRAWWVTSPGTDEALLSIAMHHVVTDAGSGQIIMDGLARAVDELWHGRPPELPEPAPSFGDLAEGGFAEAAFAEAAFADGDPAEAAAQPYRQTDLDYWRRLLMGFRPSADRHPSARDARSRTYSVRVEAPLASDLRRFAVEEDTTPFGVLMTALAECERRWTGTTDVLIGYPVSRRESAWTAPLVGLLIDTIVVRFTGPGGTTGRAAVRLTQQALQDNAAHLGGSCSAALRELDQGSGRPAFSTWLNHLGTPDRPPRLPGVRTELVDVEEPPAIFARNFYVTDDGDTLGLTGVFTGHCPPDVARDQLDQLVLTLIHLVREPDRPVNMARLVTQRATTAREEPTPAGAPASPYRLLVLDGPAAPRRAAGDATRWLSYDELARAVADRRPAVEPVDRDTVLLSLDRTLDRVLDLVALLGQPGRVALWDPGQPVAWKAGYLDALRSLDPPDRAVAEYVMPTSGTTGPPSPVACDVTTLVAMIEDYLRALEVGAGDRFVLTAALAHDPLLRDVLAPLMSGGSLFVPSSEDWHDPVRLIGVLLRQEPTIANLTPQLARLLVAAAAGRKLPSLRAVVVSGDVLRLDDVADLRRLLPRAEIYHGYGLTESPQLPSLSRLPDRCDEVLIGPGRPGSELRVLDAIGRPCGLGQPGQIHIRSRHLAPAASPPLADRSTGPGAAASGRPLRQLATGDRGELVGNGRIRFLGRMDTQVSVNGERLDLRLVDATLSEDPGVADVATLAVPSPRGDELVTLVRLEQGLTVGPGRPVQLRQLVRRRLPRAYVPRRVVIVDEVPRGVNGKVDRDAAHRLAERVVASEPAQGQPPQTGTEREVAALWQAHLGLRYVPTDENFFDLGGTSLVLLQVHAAMTRRWTTCPSVLTCYEHPTVGELAQIIDAAPGWDGAERGDGAGHTVAQRRMRSRGSRLAERERRTRARRQG